MGRIFTETERVDVQGGIRESVSFLGDGPPRLFSVLHHPIGEPTRAVIVVPSLLTDRIRTYRAEVGTARAMARTGTAVLRIDYRGFGHSDDHPATASSMLEDLAVARAALKAEVGGLPITLMGVKWGALVAAAGAGPDDQVILWEPPLSGRAYFREASRANQIAVMGSPDGSIVERDATEVLGFSISDDLRSDAETLVLDDVAVPRRALWLTTASRPPGAAQKVIDRWRDQGADVSVSALGTDESWWFIQAGALPDDALVGTTVEWIQGDPT